MDKGNSNKHRPGIPGGPKAVEESKWGAKKSEKLTEGYRKRGEDVLPPPPTPHEVEWGASRGNMAMQGRARDWADDTASDWRRGMGKGEAEGKPNFDHRGKDGKPDKW